MSASASVFRALADPTRRQILQDLRGGELSAGDIAAGFDVSGPAISRHLAILKAAGLVTERREGNRIYYEQVTHAIVDVLAGYISAACPTQVVLRRKRKARSRK